MGGAKGETGDMDFYQITVYALILGFVAVFWKASQWAMASTRAMREEQSLTPDDLLKLKDACEDLIADLRAAADESTAQVEGAIRKAELVLNKMQGAMPATIVAQIADDTMTPPDILLNESSEVLVGGPAQENAIDLLKRVYHLADQGYSLTDIARRENRSPGEVKLILDVRNLQAQQEAA